MEPNIKELYFCVSKYSIIFEVMDNPGAQANASKNFQADLNDLVSKGAHTRSCEGYEDLEASLEQLRQILRDKFPRIMFDF
jgi:hypothetical protein